MSNEDIYGLDMGAGGFKLYGRHGGVTLESQAAIATDAVAQAADGLRSDAPPMRIGLNGHRYYVGMDAHHWGRPVENLDDSRFVAGAPELRALTLGAMFRYMWTYGAARGDSMQEATLWVGLPQSAVNAESAAGLRRWLRDVQRFRVALNGGDDQERAYSVQEVGVTSQVVGALYDAILDESGQYTAEGKALYKRETCVISVGMSTLEVSVVEAGKVNHQFDLSETSGVRRLFDLLDPRGYYSRGEMDTKFRLGTLDVTPALPAWESEIVGHIEKRLGKARRRFPVVIAVGGGMLLLRETFAMLFEGKAHIPDDPIMAIARGLYKWGRLKASRKRG